MKKLSPNFKLEKKESYTSKKKYQFEIRHFINGPHPGAFEAVGYLPYKGLYLMVVYTSPKIDAFNKHLKAFYAALDNISPYTTELSPLSGKCLSPAKATN